MAGGMGDSDDTAAGAALECLQVFGSAGAKGFAMSITDEHEKLLNFRRNRSLGQMRHSMPDLLPWCARRWQNVIIRPLARDV